MPTRYFYDLVSSMLKLKILIVDSNAGHLQVLADIIKNDCRQLVSNANSPLQAIELIRETNKGLDPYDAVFADYIMADINSLDLCRELYTIDPRLSLVLITPDGSIKTKYELAAFALLTGVIVKGDGIDRIARLLCMLLSKKRFLLNTNQAGKAAAPGVT